LVFSFLFFSFLVEREKRLGRKSNLDFVFPQGRNAIADVKGNVATKINGLMYDEGEPNNDGLLRVVLKHIFPSCFQEVHTRLAPKTKGGKR